jgi:hypothetical protein
VSIFFAYNVIAKKMKDLVRRSLRDAILFRFGSVVKPRRSPFRGSAKLLVSEDELERSVEEADSAIFRRGWK